MARRRKPRYDAYTAIKSHQHVTRLQAERVHDWEIDDMFIDPRSHLVNRKRRSKLGHIQGRRPR